MSAWSFEDIERVMGGRWRIGPAGGDDVCAFAGVAIDTRAIEKGQFFFAFVGERVDGHDYLHGAGQAGASVCVVSDVSKVPDDLPVPVLVVDDVLGAMTRLASAWREKIGAKVIAITGSNGKTTTCRMVHAVCGQAGKACCSIKSFNNAIGVPMTILNTPIDAAYLIAEVGTSSHGEIEARSRLLKPDIAMIVSIGHAHLEELGGIEGVAKEKAAIVHGLGDDGLVIVPVGIEPLEEAIQVLRASGSDVPVEHLDARSDLMIESSDESTPTMLSFVFKGESFVINIGGAHNASNAAMAVMVGRLMGIDDALIRRGLASAKAPAMRFERVEIGETVIYNDAYNANLDSMRASLAAFDEVGSESLKLAVLGEMLELGSHSQGVHQSLVDSLDRYAAVDRFVLVGEGFGAMGLDNPKIEHVAHWDQGSIDTIAGGIKPGSVVLIKGSRGVGLERIVYSLQRQVQGHS